jgi:hypothetical protein
VDRHIRGTAPSQTDGSATLRDQRALFTKNRPRSLLPSRASMTAAGCPHRTDRVSCRGSRTARGDGMRQRPWSARGRRARSPCHAPSSGGVVRAARDWRRVPAMGAVRKAAPGATQDRPRSVPDERLQVIVGWWLWLASSDGCLCPSGEPSGWSATVQAAAPRLAWSWRRICGKIVRQIHLRRSKLCRRISVKPSAKPTLVRTQHLPPAKPQLRPSTRTIRHAESARSGPPHVPPVLPGHHRPT